MKALIHIYKGVQITYMTNQISAETCDQHDRQCIYDVTFQCVPVTTINMEKQNVLHILSVCL